MSRTDRHRPYYVQCHDTTMRSVEQHDHTQGDCDMYTLQEWKRRFDDKQRRISGARFPMFDCQRELVSDAEFRKCVKRNPVRRYERKQFKRNQRHKVKRLCQRATEFDNMRVYLGITEQYPSKAYYRSSTYQKTKRPYVSKHRYKPVVVQQPPISYEEWLQSPYAYYREHRMDIKSMHGKQTKAA